MSSRVPRLLDHGFRQLTAPLRLLSHVVSSGQHLSWRPFKPGHRNGRSFGQTKLATQLVRSGFGTWPDSQAAHAPVPALGATVPSGQARHVSLPVASA
jgi:hypothetical protein